MIKIMLKEPVGSPPDRECRAGFWVVVEGTLSKDFFEDLMEAKWFQGKDSAGKLVGIPISNIAWFQEV